MICTRNQKRHIPIGRTIRIIMGVGIVSAAFSGDSAAGTVPAEVIAMAVESAVMREIGAEGIDMEISVPHAREMDIPGCEAPRVRAGITARMIRGRTAPVRVEFLNAQGDLLKRTTMIAHIKTYARAVILLRNVSRGDTLRTDDLAVRRVEVRGLGEFYTEPGDLEGVCARSSLKAGEILRAAKVRPAPLVHRGDRVTIRAAVGGVELVAEGIVRQDGVKGECIRVYNEMTRNSVRCRVVDGKTVMVEKEGM